MTTRVRPNRVRPIVPRPAHIEKQVVPTETRVAKKFTPAGPRPFLKWAGGKGKLLDQIVPHLPKSYGRYFESFTGGAALFWHLTPERAVLSDANDRLVNTYQILRDESEPLIAQLSEWRYDLGSFVAIRDGFNSGDMGPIWMAAAFLYLNKCGFNGLYRVNGSGQFNVPFGRYVNPTICDAENLRSCSDALQGVPIVCADYDSVLSSTERPMPGDLVYLDPPYVPEPRKASFVGYVAGGFGDEEQQRLASRFRELADRGVYVLASNSASPRVRELYAGFRMIELTRSGTMNSDPTKRGKVPELLILGWS